jgi:hypothetical protein
MRDSLDHRDTQLEGTERGSKLEYFKQPPTALAFGCALNNECEVLSVSQLLCMLK